MKQRPEAPHRARAALNRDAQIANDVEAVPVNLSPVA